METHKPGVFRGMGSVLAGVCLLVASGMAGPAVAGELLKDQSLLAPDGRTRWYHVYKPESLAIPAPVVVLLHAEGSSYNRVVDATRSGYRRAVEGSTEFTQWLDIADEEGLLLLIPNGISLGGDARGEAQHWNDCRNGIEAAGAETGADDIGFLGQLLEQARARYGTNPERVYVAGQGSALAYRAAMELDGRVAAAAVFLAQQPIDAAGECAAPREPVSMFLLHGSVDPQAPSAGGCDTPGGTRGCRLSADATATYWRTHNAATVPGLTIRHPNLDLLDGVGFGGSTVSAITHGGGPEQAEVAVYTVDGGGHHLPARRYRRTFAGAAAAGAQNRDLDAVRHAWDFLRSKTLRGGIATAFRPPASRTCDGLNLSLGPVIDATVASQAVFPWQGNFLEDESICFLSRQSGAELRGYLLAPVDVAVRDDATLPLVVVGPGSGIAQATNYLWSPRALAGQGYLVLVVEPQGVGRSESLGEPASCGSGGCPGVPFQNASNYVDALQSGLDFTFGDAHPWLRKADRRRVGLAGHSLSARAAAFVGGIDPRVQAVVAWDNLSSLLSGDAGVSSGGGPCGSLIGGELPLQPRPVTLRVPSLGQASDRVPGCDPSNTDPELKKTGYAQWRAAGIPSMQLVMFDVVHGDWGQTRDSDPDWLEIFHYYTQAWFDLYLRHEVAARDRLLAEVLSLTASSPSRQDRLSTQFRSAGFMPDARIDCADLLGAPCLPLAPALAPVLDGVIDLLVDEDGMAALDLGLQDADSPLSALVLHAESDDAGLVRDADIGFEGSGARRQLLIRPQADRSGIVTVRIAATDGVATSVETLRLTVRAVNDAPVISLIADQDLRLNSTVAALDFHISDAETAAQDLDIAIASSDEELIALTGLHITGSAAERRLALTPTGLKTGSGRIRVTVSDGQSSTVREFAVRVMPGEPAADASLLAELAALLSRPFQASAPVTDNRSGGGALGLGTLALLLAFLPRRLRRDRRVASRP